MDVEPEEYVDEFAIHKLLGEGGQAKYNIFNLVSTWAVAMDTIMLSRSMLVEPPKRQHIALRLNSWGR